VRPGDPSPYRDGGGLISRLRWLSGYASEFRGWCSAAAAAARQLISEDVPTVWHGHDLTGLVPAAACAKRRTGALVYDSHELYLEAGSAARLPRPLRRLLANYERALSRRSGLVITVNDSIADEFVKRYGIVRPVVVRNCPPKGPEPIARSASLLRRFTGTARTVLLHHGALCEGRGIPATVAALKHLPSSFMLALLGDGELVPWIKSTAAEPEFRGRLIHHPAVPFYELPKWIAGSDIGMICLEAIDRNSYYAAPNKLFECLGAGVPVVVSNFPEMRRVVGQHDVGRACNPEDPESIAAAVLELFRGTAEEIATRSTRCRIVAKNYYNWELEGARLLQAYPLGSADLGLSASRTFAATRK
jgi:glycosyltransferase involved in cell wall biosynthesis